MQMMRIFSLLKMCALLTALSNCGCVDGYSVAKNIHVPLDSDTILYNDPAHNRIKEPVLSGRQMSLFSDCRQFAELFSLLADSSHPAIYSGDTILGKPLAFSLVGKEYRVFLSTADDITIVFSLWVPEEFDSVIVFKSLSGELSSQEVPVITYAWTVVNDRNN